MARYAHLAVLFFAAIAASCRATKSSLAIDPGMASCVPADTVVLAGVDLDKILATPLYQSQLSGILSAFPSLRDTAYLLAAYNAHDLLFIGRGKYAAAPPGATLVSGGLAVSGTPESVRAAVAQHQSGVSGSPRLVELTAGIAGGRPVWMVIQGGVTLPLTGNASNLNRVLHLTQYVTMTLQIDSRIQLEADAVGRNANASRELEESLRALLTLAAAESGRQPAIAAALQSVEIRRDDLTVNVRLAASAESTAELIRQLTK